MARIKLVKSTKVLSGFWSKVSILTSIDQNIHRHINKETGNRCKGCNDCWKRWPCWNWKGNNFSQGGYGLMIVQRQTRPAHRVAYELAHGVAPGNLEVCHRCDNRSCCNPAHLWLGTHAENMHDMATKGRHFSRTKPELLSRGDAHYARLNPEKLARGDNHGSRTHPERVPRGESHGNSTINSWKACGIIASWLQGNSATKTSRDHAVSYSMVNHIIRGETWTHLFNSREQNEKQ